MFKSFLKRFQGTSARQVVSTGWKVIKRVFQIGVITVIGSKCISIAKILTNDLLSTMTVSVFSKS